MKKLHWSMVVAGWGVLCCAVSLSAQEPKALYDKNCKTCHGPVGGQPSAAMKARMNPPALDAAFLATVDDAKFMQSMQKGGQKMRPLDGKMTKQQMEAVMKYVRDFVKTGGK